MKNIIQKITKKTDFDKMFKVGSWINSPNLSARLASSSEIIKDAKILSGSKFAISVGAKFSKRAVDRNKIKRQIFSVLRKINKEEKLPQEKYLLFVPKSGALKISFAELEGEINSIIKKCGK